MHISVYPYFQIQISLIDLMIPFLLSFLHQILPSKKYTCILICTPEYTCTSLEKNPPIHFRYAANKKTQVILSHIFFLLANPDIITALSLLQPAKTIYFKIVI